MFDMEVPPEPEVLRSADDEAVVAAIEAWTRIEAAASARRLDAIAELTSRRCDTNPDDERAHWACDGWDSTAGEIAAAMGISPRKASGQMSVGLMLRQRLPRLGALALAGRVSARVLATISWRTHHVEGESALAALDAALVQRAAQWGELSELKLEASIDHWVMRHDPAALRTAEPKARTRDFFVGKKHDERDTTAVWGRLDATDAALLDRRLLAMLAGICDADPRTIDERRADAVGAIAAGAARLACRCARPQCPGGGNDGRAANVVIHVLTDTTPPRTPAAAPARSRVQPAAILLPDKIISAPMLAELIRSGAQISPVRTPPAAPEAGYVPSKALAEFVRCRDMTCRFPGCDKPAEFCDIDHTIPHPIGPTHPSNLKCLCRKHHLLKTFWTGVGGWADSQLPDGTVVWTAPTGRTYKTLPASRIFFPDVNTTTAPLPPTTAPVPQTPGRTLMMPTRSRTRAAQRAQHIKQQRALTAAQNAKWAAITAAAAEQRSKPPPPEDPHSWIINTSGPADYDDDPPPF